MWATISINHADSTNEMFFEMSVIKKVSFTVKLNCVHTDFC